MPVVEATVTRPTAATPGVCRVRDHGSLHTHHGGVAERIGNLASGTSGRPLTLFRLTL
ncbi:hypothetical protein [Micromonospora sp. CB01531]|uniref:hypothetical protein n=1 Tax=Micromonospora sp. CB01531 TaxID=1718947 RepID=UPI000A9C87C5|nr:hypothetical protein [Micromonospora sp. CB01531]